MAKEFSRSRRVGEQLKRELAELIRDQGDERLNLASITAVEVTRDMAYGKVFITLLDEPTARPAAVERLNQLAPAFRRQLGKTLRLRTIPKLTFLYDEAVERGAELSALIDNAVKADRAAAAGRDDQQDEHSDRNDQADRSDL